MLLAYLLPDVVDLLLLTYDLWAPGITFPVLVGVFWKHRSRALSHLALVARLVSTAARPERSGMVEAAGPGSNSSWREP